MTRLVLSAAFAVIAAPSSAQRFDIKNGLWETIIVVESVKFPDEYVKKASPQRRAEFEKTISTIKAREFTYRQCFTDKDRENMLPNFDEVAKCNPTLVSRTTRRVEWRLQCRGNPPKTGRLVVEAVNPETSRGRIDFKIDSPEMQLEMTHVATSKWLGADCAKQK